MGSNRSIQEISRDARGVLEFLADQLTLFEPEGANLLAIWVPAASLLSIRCREGIYCSKKAREEICYLNKLKINYYIDTIAAITYLGINQCHIKTYGT